MNNPDTHSCLITRYDPRDFIKGDGNIPEKLFAASVNDWTPYFHFKELQMINGYETDCCVIFSASEILDAEIDYLISAGKLSAQTIEWFNQLGFMDSINSDDQKAHFHSSPRYWSVLTGNKNNGNALQDPWIAAQKYGAIPWTSLPFDATVADFTDYFAPIPQALLDLGQQFLLGVGGKKWIQYQWCYNISGGGIAFPTLDADRARTPLQIGVAVGNYWNQVEPNIQGGAPGHSITNYDSAPDGEACLDHYIPFFKVLVNGYPIPQVLQAIVTITPPPAPPAAPVPTPATPTSPAQPVTVPQLKVWLLALSSWLSNILETITPTGRAKLCGASRSSEWPAFKKEYALTHLPVCAICGGTAQLNLHHLRPFHVFPELELDPTNVVWLCNAKLCHIRVGHLSNFTSINPNGAADIVIWRDKIRNRPNTPEEIKADFNQQ